MAYFPDKTRTKVELQESTTEQDLSCTHLTTANFFELNVGYYRETTPREYFKCNQGIFCRPVPMQAPVMGEAVLKLKNYFVPYRVLSPQWNDYITKSPHVPYNGASPIIVTKMPYTTAFELAELFASNYAVGISNSTITTNNDWDFRTANGDYKLTKKGRHNLKILSQLGYVIYPDNKVNDSIDMMPLLALAKVYLDYYTTNQYSQTLANAYTVEALLKKDNINPYKLTAQDINNILDLCAYVMYSPDYFTSCWDNPVSPNEVNSSWGKMVIKDPTTYGDGITETDPNVYNGTPTTSNRQANLISQYMLDSLKKLTDWVKRMQISTKSIDRYLARFGVILTSEKMNRSMYNGEQIAKMNFGAIYSTAETQQASIGDYAGQGIINSDGQEQTTFEFEELDEMGCIISLFSINPKIGYYQGIDRNHLATDVETRFTGAFDALGTQAVLASELYVSNDYTSIYGTQQVNDTIFGYLPRYAHLKVAKDRLTGDFTRENINAGADAWHMFRKIDESTLDPTNFNLVHSPDFVSTKSDASQYNRIFNYTKDDNGDKFNVCLQFAIKVRMHAKALYDSYDFEGEGKKIIMDGQGAKQN